MMNKKDLLAHRLGLFNRVFTVYRSCEKTIEQSADADLDTRVRVYLSARESQIRELEVGDPQEIRQWLNRCNMRAAMAAECEGRDYMTALREQVDPRVHGPYLSSLRYLWSLSAQYRAEGGDPDEIVR